ncbi:Periaxin [Cytospora mali]|uniref:Periaxin n=1 Tax=Cytospora mali TaxID=578113 RepID=A0A194UQT6_CYTMA|nr:Periaxin [Valsa mali var. pyri (nom. inval.)]
MEPVPETEKLEEFRPTPLPTLRLHHSNYNNMQSSTSDPEPPRKPPTMRRSTDPSPSSPISPTWNAAALPYRPRTTSPLSGNHTRSKSAATLVPPPMGRAQSMPGVNGLGHILIPRPQSPKGSPSPTRQRAMRKPVDEVYPPVSPTRSSVLPERQLSERNSSPNLPFATPLVRQRRTSSPLRHFASSSTSSLPGSLTCSVTSSPMQRPFDSISEKDSYTFAAAYPPSSSIPSTPISVRSRSPSISSLETIPDSPDAEEAAVEADRIAQLKADADEEDGSENKGRNCLDGPFLTDMYSKALLVAASLFWIPVLAAPGVPINHEIRAKVADAPQQPAQDLAERDAQAGTPADDAFIPSGILTALFPTGPAYTTLYSPFPAVPALVSVISSLLGPFPALATVTAVVVPVSILPPSFLTATPSLPTLRAPTVSLPTLRPVTLPGGALPTLSLPTLSPPSLGSLPTLSLPPLSLPTLPTLSLPPLSVSPPPSLSLPTFSLPPLSLPTVPPVTLPGGALPTLSFPPLSLPTFSLPSLALPGVSPPPSLSLPTFSLPTLSLPTFSLPSLSLPSIVFPSDISFSVPGLTTRLTALPPAITGPLSITTATRPEDCPQSYVTVTQTDTLTLYVGHPLAPNVTLTAPLLNVTALSNVTLPTFTGSIATGLFPTFPNVTSVVFPTLTLPPFPTLPTPHSLGGFASVTNSTLPVLPTLPPFPTSLLTLPSISLPSVSILPSLNFTLPSIVIPTGLPISFASPGSGSQQTPPIPPVLSLTASRSNISSTLSLPTSLVIAPTVTPISTASVSSFTVPSSAPATGTVGPVAPTGTPSPQDIHCGIRGAPIGDYYLATYAWNKRDVPVTLEGCYQFCNNVFGITEGCQSFNFYLEPGLGSPRCDLYAGTVAFEVASISPYEPYTWFDLACGDPVKWLAGH